MHSQIGWSSLLLTIIWRIESLAIWSLASVISLFYQTLLSSCVAIRSTQQRVWHTFKLMQWTALQNPRRKLRMCSVLFLPVQSFRSSLTRFADFVSLSFVTITLPQTVRLFYISLRSQAPQQQYRHRAQFLFFDAKAWPQSQTDLFTYTTVLHCGHTFFRRIDLIYSGIALWAYLSEPLVKDSHKRLKFDGKTTIRTACSNSRDHTFTVVRALNLGLYRFAHEKKFTGLPQI